MPKPKKTLNKSALKWALNVTVLSFFISVALTLAAGHALTGAGLALAIAVLSVFIILGVVFDMLGMAVATASEKPFHSMAARRVPGASESIKFIRHSDKVASFCSDVVGDICGIVSGASAATIVLLIVGDSSGSPTVAELVVSGVLVGLTVGGKAIGKPIAMRHRTVIVLFIGRVIHTYKSLRRKLRKKRRSND